jgi:hypothetical protein
MQRLVLSTDYAPEAEGFAYWREAVAEAFIGATGERKGDEAAPFTGRIEAAVGGSITHMRYRADEFGAARTGQRYVGSTSRIRA